jgi:hypothetical protein
MHRARLLIAHLGLALARHAALAAPAASPAPPPAFECVSPEPALVGAALAAFCQRQHVAADACHTQGGAWGIAGLSPPGTLPVCRLPTSDAGKACRTNSQCRQSTCVPDNEYGPASGPPTGHCDRYGERWEKCDTTLEGGVIVRPPPCPVF